tara:strand:- start:4519 stop:4797 length:279 start_codon:yes stop_codon:yes gene_type:complete
MKLILEDYEKINDDAFEGTFYYGNEIIIAQISTDWLIDYEENTFEINAVVLSAQQYDDNDQPTELTITNEEIENFVENNMHEWFDNYLKKIA